MTGYTVDPIGHVRCARVQPDDDGWDSFPATIDLAEQYGPETLAGLDAFSHAEIIYLFDKVEPSEINTSARRPRGRADWPEVGIFAQRGKGRPNRLGATICRITSVSGRTLSVTGLDAIDGTPVLDIKPVMKGFLPRGDVSEPGWAGEIMQDYWRLTAP
jgi:tRNA-Thr(GGU) m(6)t(6)A37 methyltransferase TsaA